jgi:hypothetical protein
MIIGGHYSPLRAGWRLFSTLVRSKRSFADEPHVTATATTGISIPRKAFDE